MKRPPANRQRKPRPRLPQDVATQAQTKGLSPLAYMLRVLRDPNASKQRRDRMAVVAARYVHPRMSDYRVPKKDQRAAEAKKAGGSDTEWAGDLDPDGHRPQ